jgi:hypothetical protein
MAIITILSASITTGCNEPKPTVPAYQAADWTGLNKLVTEIEVNDVNNCLKDKSTCEKSTQEGLDFVKSMEGKK